MFRGLLLPVPWGSLPSQLMRGKAKEEVRRASNFAERRGRSDSGEKRGFFQGSGFY